MIRKILKRLIGLLPAVVVAWILRIWRLRKIRLNKFKLEFPALRQDSASGLENTVYWVNPDRIVYTMNSEGLNQAGSNQQNRNNSELYLPEYTGRVIDGSWDKLERKFSELDFFRSYEERALHGTGWEQLPYYRRVLEQIEAGREKWGCRSKKDLDDRCRKLDAIYKSIKENGYKSRQMLKEERPKESLLDEDDEIAVNIGRHGDLIFNNGRHRLTFAKIAGITEVPVTITVRHTMWAEFVKEVEASIPENDDRPYPLMHIGLQTIRLGRNDESYRIISSNIGKGNRTLLDVGAQWGYYCHRFEEAGLDCTAVENNPENIYFLEKLKRAEGRKFEVIRETVADLSNRGPLKYDVVLALDVLHNFLKDKQSYEALKRFIHNLDANEMYLEPGRAAEGSNYIEYTPEEFIEFIIENSCFKEYKLIGEYGNGRVIYKLWR